MQEFYTIMEYATPLLAMEQGHIANLDYLEKRNQMVFFKEKVNDILRHPSNKHCHNTAVLLVHKGKTSLELAHIACFFIPCLQGLENIMINFNYIYKIVPFILPNHR